MVRFSTKKLKQPRAGMKYGVYRNKRLFTAVPNKRLARSFISTAKKAEKKLKR